MVTRYDDIMAHNRLKWKQWKRCREKIGNMNSDYFRCCSRSMIFCTTPATSALIYQSMLVPWPPDLTDDDMLLDKYSAKLIFKKIHTFDIEPVFECLIKHLLQLFPRLCSSVLEPKLCDSMAMYGCSVCQHISFIHLWVPAKQTAHLMASAMEILTTSQKLYTTKITFVTLLFQYNRPSYPLNGQMHCTHSSWPWCGNSCSFSVYLG